MIKELELHNFKTFDDLHVEFRPFNVVIGANASGKSSLVEVFRFLRNISAYGFRDALSMQGGVGYVRNMAAPSQTETSIRVISDTQALFAFMSAKELPMGVKVSRMDYNLRLEYAAAKPEAVSATDSVELTCEMVVLRHGEGSELEEDKPLGRGTIKYCINDKGDLDCEDRFTPPLQVEKSKWMGFSFKPLYKITPNVLLLDHPHMVPLFSSFIDLLMDVSIHDTDPKRLKEAVAITGKSELEEDGRNLRIVLREILANQDKKRTFLNLIRDLLPFVEDIEIEQLADKSLLLGVNETYAPNVKIPASLMSDGTINIAALVVAVYFNPRSLIIIEEPERNIHPSLIGRLVQLLKEQSSKKQIIVTTHSPEIVKHVDPEDLLLISRNESGFSRIRRPADSEETRIFLKNEVGIEDLYVQDLLGAQS